MVNLNLSYILRSYPYPAQSCGDVHGSMHGSSVQVSDGVVHVRTAAEAGGSGCACADGLLREDDRARRTFGREVTCCDVRAK